MKIEFEGKTRQEISDEVDLAIREVDPWYRTLQPDGEGLTPFERAAIKTFLGYWVVGPGAKEKA